MDSADGGVADGFDCDGPECPFCGEADEYHRESTRDVQQYSHNATETVTEECDACGYRCREVWRGNARRTSTQEWRKVQQAERMPDDYCLAVCPECEHVWRAEIGSRNERRASMGREQSSCCGAEVRLAYTFADAPGKTALEERDPTWTGLRKIRPHLREGTGTKGGFRTAFESPRGLVVRVGDDWVEVVEADESLENRYSTAFPDVIEAKLRRDDDWDEIGDQP